MTIAVLIVAAGRGSRLGGEVPKQYLPLSGLCVLRRTLSRFLDMDEIAVAQTVIHPDDRAMYDAAIDGVEDQRLLPPAEGGATRAKSVQKGLEALLPHAPSLVLIHDAARPFVSPTVIRDVIEALETVEGACAGLPVVDALWSSEGLDAKVSVPRNGLWRAQTPQGFHFDKILSAHRSQDADAADDVAIARTAGMRVRFVPGSERNFKITTQDDLDRAALEVAREDER